MICRSGGEQVRMTHRNGAELRVNRVTCQTELLSNILGLWRSAQKYVHRQMDLTVSLGKFNNYVHTFKLLHLIIS